MYAALHKKSRKMLRCKIVNEQNKYINIINPLERTLTYGRWSCGGRAALERSLARRKLSSRNRDLALFVPKGGLTPDDDMGTWRAIRQLRNGERP